MAKKKKDLRRAKGRKAKPEEVDHRPEHGYIEYITNSDLVNTLFRRIARALATSRLWFNRGGQIVFIHPAHGLQVVRRGTLNGYLSRFLEIRFLTKSKDSEGNEKLFFKRHGLLPRDMVGMFLEAPQVAAQLKPLRHYTRSPLFDDQWHLVNKPGYHAEAEMFYDGEPLKPARRAPVLTRVLSEFCWRTPADRVGFIGVLLTAITALIWVGRHPLVVFSANQSGVGKTLLARLLATILDAAEHLVGFHADEEEFEKQLATGTEHGNRVLGIDNVRLARGAKEIASSVLERCVTATTLKFRRLGKIASIIRANDVLFVLTMNNARLGPDLRRRSLPVRLHYDGNIDVRSFSVNELAKYVGDHRLEILAELIGMVTGWLKAGRPLPSQPAQHSVSNEWAATIDAILQFNGYTGFLTNFDDATADADLDFHELLEICEVCQGEPKKTALAWAKCLSEKGLLRDQLYDLDSGFPKSDQAQATIVGTLFTKYVGWELPCPSGIFCIRSTPRGKSHASVEYWFEPVPQESTRLRAA